MSKKIGYFPFLRSFSDDPMWRSLNPEYRSIFLVLLINSAYERTKQDDCGVETIIEKGQVLMTEREIIEEAFPPTKDLKTLQKYKSCVHRALKKFESLGFSTHKTNHKKLIHTIIREDILNACEPKKQTSFSQENIIEPSFKKKCKKSNLETNQKNEDVSDLNSIVNEEFENEFEPRNEPNSNQELVNFEPTTIYIKEIKKDKKVYTSDSVESRLAVLLFSEIKKIIPNRKKPNIQSWAEQIDSMIRIDKRNPQEMEEMILWVFSKSIFWRQNVLCPQKLCEFWDRLYLAKTESEKKTHPSVKEKVIQKFKHGEIYNGAECLISDESIAFTRGMKHRQLKFKEYGFESQFDSILRDFDISYAS